MYPTIAPANAINDKEPLITPNTLRDKDTRENNSCQNSRKDGEMKDHFAYNHSERLIRCQQSLAVQTSKELTKSNT